MTAVTMLIAVGVGFVACLLLLFVLVRYGLPWWLKRKVGAMAEQAAATRLAARITLGALPANAAWQQPGTAGVIRQIVEEGFIQVGRYAVPEMPGIQLWAGVHPQEGYAAVVYDHPKMPPMFDLCRFHVDRSSCTVTSNPLHNPANIPPGNTCVADADFTPDGALAVLRAQPLTGEPLRLDAGNFAAVYIEAYARSMDHILSRPPPDAQQMQQIGAQMAELTGEPAPVLDEVQMEQAVRMQQFSRQAALEQAILDRFLESGQIDARSWERLRDDTVVVHDLLSREDAADLARSRADFDDTDLLVIGVLEKELPPIDTFEAVTAALPEAQRLRLLGEVDHPLYAQVYTVQA
jgi:hypothetical protein